MANKLTKYNNRDLFSLTEDDFTQQAAAFIEDGPAKIPDVWQINSLEFVKAFYSLFAIYNGQAFVGSHDQARYLMMLKFDCFFPKNSFTRLLNDMISAGLVVKSEQKIKMGPKIGYIRFSSVKQSVYFQQEIPFSTEPMLKRITEGYSSLIDELVPYTNVSEIRKLKEIAQSTGRKNILTPSDRELLLNYSPLSIKKLAGKYEANFKNPVTSNKNEQIFQQVSDYIAEITKTNDEVTWVIIDMLATLKELLLQNVVTVEAIYYPNSFEPLLVMPVTSIAMDPQDAGEHLDIVFKSADSSFFLKMIDLEIELPFSSTYKFRANGDHNSGFGYLSLSVNDDVFNHDWVTTLITYDIKYQEMYEELGLNAKAALQGKNVFKKLHFKNDVR